MSRTLNRTVFNASIPASDPSLYVAYNRYRLNEASLPTTTTTASGTISCTLIVVHATSLCKEVYEPFLMQLKIPCGEVISYDIRNHGQSMVINGPLSMKETYLSGE